MLNLEQHEKNFVHWCTKNGIHSTEPLISIFRRAPHEAKAAFDKLFAKGREESGETAGMIDDVQPSPPAIAKTVGAGATGGGGGSAAVSADETGVKTDIEPVPV